MAKIKQLEKSLKDKSKKEAKQLRFGNKTEKQKKFLKENPNVKPAAIPEKKKVEPVEQKSTTMPAFEDWHPGQHEKVQGLYSLKDIQNWKETDGKIAKHFYQHGNENQKLLCISLMRWLKKQENSAKEQGRDI